MEEKVFVFIKCLLQKDCLTTPDLSGYNNKYLFLTTISTGQGDDPGLASGGSGSGLSLCLSSWDPD